MGKYIEEKIHYAAFPVEMEIIDCAVNRFNDYSKEYLAATTDKEAGIKRIEKDGEMLISIFTERFRKVINKYKR